MLGEELLASSDELETPVSLAAETNDDSDDIKKRNRGNLVKNERIITKTRKKSDSGFFDVNETQQQLEFMVEAVSTLVKNEIIARESMTEAVEPLDAAEHVSVSGEDGFSFLPITNNVQRRSVPSPHLSFPPRPDGTSGDLADARCSSSRTSNGEERFMSKEKPPKAPNGIRDEFYSTDSDYSEDSDWVGSGSCRSLSSPSTTSISKNDVDTKGWNNLYETGKLCKLILRRNGGIYSTRFAENLEKDEKNEAAAGSGTSSITSDGEVTSFDAENNWSSGSSTSSSTTHLQSGHSSEMDVEASSDSSVDIDTREENDRPRCSLCGCTRVMPGDELTSGTSGMSGSLKPLIAMVGSNICLHCLRPYELWKREPWRWNLFLKRCDTKCTGFGDHGDVCISCNFWRRVDFVSSAIDKCSGTETSDDPIFDTSCSCKHLIKECERKTSMAASVKRENDEVRNDSLIDTSIIDNKEVSEASKDDSVSATSSPISHSDSSKILSEEDRLKCSHYFETGISLPRVKYVCRNRETAIGTRLPRATFPVLTSGDESEKAIVLSAIPLPKKESMWSACSSSDDEDEVPCWPPSNRPKLLCPVNSGLNGGDVKVSEDQCWKVEKTGSKRRRDDSLARKAPKASFKRTPRCGQCKGCHATDCGSCTNCLDMPKFGGPGVAKQACVQRQCELLVALKRQRKEGKLVSPGKGIV